jgi:peptide/nickel transport system substrate-binding protein
MSLLGHAVRHRSTVLGRLRLGAAVALCGCLGASVAAATSQEGPGSAAAGATGAGTPTRPGGTLTVLSAGDVDTIDPGVTYYTFGAMVAGATQRAVLAARPDQPGALVPDLAAAPPEVSADGRAVTVHLRPGIRFSPPVNRDVTSHDVKYAIERGFFRTVGNPYAASYFGDLVGARPDVAPGTTIAGLETPDDLTLVLRLSRPRGGFVVNALVLPLSAPVPQEHAARFDKARQSTYGVHQVATGPYMIANDAQGRTVGYRPGRSIQLVRNPNWVAATDFRPAALDAVQFRQGRTDLVKTSRAILAGHRMVSGDFFAPRPVLRRDLPAHRAQFAVTSGGGTNYMSMNTRLRPLDDVDVRRAVVAGFDRAEMLSILGGDLAGQVANHYIPPEMPGFAEAGGTKGTGSPLYASPRGDRKLAARYLRRAGYRSGRYTGNRIITAVSSDDSTGVAVGRSAQRSLRRLGFRVRLRVVSIDRMFQMCAEPARKIHVCPFLGWFRDFPDAETIIDPLFSGRNIRASGNNNVAQLNDPAVNRAIDAAKALVDPQARAQAWAAIDRQVVDLAPAVALFWPKVAAIRSADVNAVPNWLYGGTWDLGFTALTGG